MTDLLDIDCEAILSQDLDITAGLAANPLPGTATEVQVVRPRREKRRKRPFGTRVLSQCRCHGYAATGTIGPAPRHAETAYDLCCNGPTLEKAHACQVYSLFRLSLTEGHPADYVPVCHGFEPDDDDREHLEWICFVNAREWLLPAELGIYGRLPPSQRTPRPANWMSLSQEERVASDREFAEQTAREKAALDAVVIAESTLTEFLEAYRAAVAEHELRVAETCPPMAVLLVARKTGDYQKIRVARQALREWERLQRSLYVGLTKERHEHWVESGIRASKRQVHH